MKLLLLFLFLIPIYLLSYDWSLKQNEKGQIVERIVCPDSLNCYALVQHELLTKVYKSTDRSDTWVLNERPPEMTVNTYTLCVTWAGRTPLICTWDAGIFRYEGDFFKFPPDTRGVEELLITNYQLLISPNPADDYIEITVGAHCNVPVHDFIIQIYNIFGECVTNPTLTLLKGEGIMRIDVSSLPSGMYFVRYGNSIDKFVKY